MNTVVKVIKTNKVPSPDATRIGLDSVEKWVIPSKKSFTTLLSRSAKELFSQTAKELHHLKETDAAYEHLWRTFQMSIRMLGGAPKSPGVSEVALRCLVVLDGALSGVAPSSQVAKESVGRIVENIEYLAQDGKFVISLARASEVLRAIYQEYKQVKIQVKNHNAPERINIYPTERVKVVASVSSISPSESVDQKVPTAMLGAASALTVEEALADYIGEASERKKSHNMPVETSANRLLVKKLLKEGLVASVGGAVGPTWFENRHFWSTYPQLLLNRAMDISDMRHDAGGVSAIDAVNALEVMSASYTIFGNLHQSAGKWIASFLSDTKELITKTPNVSNHMDHHLMVRLAILGSWINKSCTHQDVQFWLSRASGHLAGPGAAIGAWNLVNQLSQIDSRVIGKYTPSSVGSKELRLKEGIDYLMKTVPVEKKALAGLMLAGLGVEAQTYSYTESYLNAGKAIVSAVASHTDQLSSNELKHVLYVMDASAVAPSASALTANKAPAKKVKLIHPKGSGIADEGSALEKCLSYCITKKESFGHKNPSFVGLMLRRVLIEVDWVQELAVDPNLAKGIEYLSQKTQELAVKSKVAQSYKPLVESLELGIVVAQGSKKSINKKQTLRV